MYISIIVQFNLLKKKKNTIFFQILMLLFSLKIVYF